MYIPAGRSLTSPDQDKDPKGSQSGSCAQRSYPPVFRSILFPEPDDRSTEETLQPPAFFVDLNLDQIVASITASRDEYNLNPFFYKTLLHSDHIHYRHEVMQDLENPVLFEHIKSFAEKMRTMRNHLFQAGKLYYRYQRQRWFLDAVSLYCDAVRCLRDDLSGVELKSRGFRGFRDYLSDYVQSARFTSLVTETNQLQLDLAAVKYCLLLKGNTITVRKYKSEPDYSAEVEKTFRKFQQGAVKDYRVKFSEWVEMNHVEAGILDLVAQLHPDLFLRLEEYCGRNADYLDETVVRFDREIQFYMAYLEYVEKFRRAGLRFCYPQILTQSKEVFSREGFDMALAHKLLGKNMPVVCNDFYMQGKERVFVVSGPNQGGKTTFARTFGQMHYMASLGCPVPGTEARLFLYDRLFTHFEKEENIHNLRGKLQDDLLRIHDILEQATTKSIIIMNEIFTSTTLNDAVFLGKKVMGKIVELDALCVFVTFLDELASFSEKTVSMVSTVVPENPALRTYKILRRPADGLAYALSIAEKYHLTYEYLKERIKS